MKDSRFQETVIILLYHNQKNGAAGFTVNKPIETMSINKFFKSSNLVSPKNMVQKEIILYCTHILSETLETYCKCV